MSVSLPALQQLAVNVRTRRSVLAGAAGAGIAAIGSRPTHAQSPAAVATPERLLTTISFRGCSAPISISIFSSRWDSPSSGQPTSANASRSRPKSRMAITNRGWRPGWAWLTGCTVSDRPPKPPAIESAPARRFSGPAPTTARRNGSPSERPPRNGSPRSGRSTRTPSRVSCAMPHFPRKPSPSPTSPISRFLPMRCWWTIRAPNARGSSSPTAAMAAIRKAGRPDGGSAPARLQRPHLRRARPERDALRKEGSVHRRLGNRGHPLVDYLLTRPDVDPGKLVLTGVSQGGYWAPRAAARSNRGWPPWWPMAA